MSLEMDWSPDFCLACDKQTDGSVYCGEACRLAEYEKANAGSEAGSPIMQHGPTSWPSPRSTRGFFLPPAYNFDAYRHSNTSNSTRPHSSPAVLPKSSLTPSSSQSSLFSLQSSSSTTSDMSHLSDDTKRELRAYASSFDQSRYHRRQSAF